MGMQVISLTAPEALTRQHCQPGDSGYGGEQTGYSAVHRSTGPTSARSPASTGPELSAQYGLGEGTPSVFKPPSTQSHAAPVWSARHVQVVHALGVKQSVKEQPTQA